MTACRITHRTTYSYDDEVTDSLGIAHLVPRALSWQSVASYDVALSPAPVDLSHDTDYYGNCATYFQVTDPHTRLEIQAVSEVDVTTLAVSPDLLGVAWERARPLYSPEVVGAWRATDFVLPSVSVEQVDEAASYAAASFTRQRPVGEAVTDLMHRIHADFEYDRTATTVTSTVGEVLATRAGVCQDFSHFMVSALRSLGLAGRYVSGYLATRTTPGRPRLVGADASHAWVGCWIPGAGWLYLDPTNRRVIDESHATVAWGRDYGDVPPVKGVIFTEAKTSTMKVAVDMAPAAA